MLPRLTDPRPRPWSCGSVDLYQDTTVDRLEFGILAHPYQADETALGAYTDAIRNDIDPAASPNTRLL